MNNRYKIVLTYTKDIDKSFRYHDTATQFMTFVATGFYIYGFDTIQKDTEVYYSQITTIISTYVSVYKLAPELSVDSFSVEVYELKGLHDKLSSTIITTVVNESDMTLLYSGPLNDMVATLAV